MATTTELRARFRELHADGCFVLPNPWDVGSAKLLESLGFSALATSSAGLGFTLGLPDRVDVLPLPIVLEHVHALVEAINVPLNVDFQDGYGPSPDEVADNVTQLIAIGVAGFSIEDASREPHQDLLPIDIAAERVRAARSAIDASGHDVLLTARAENFLQGHPDLDDTVTRLTNYSEAGADVLFAPGLPTLEALHRVVQACSPKPINALLNGQSNIRIDEAREVGVRRISVGSALARRAWTTTITAARALANNDLTPLTEATAFAELNTLFDSN